MCEYMYVYNHLHDTHTYLYIYIYICIYIYVHTIYYIKKLTHLNALHRCPQAFGWSRPILPSDQESAKSLPVLAWKNHRKIRMLDFYTTYKNDDDWGVVYDCFHQHYGTDTKWYKIHGIWSQNITHNFWHVRQTSPNHQQAPHEKSRAYFSNLRWHVQCMEGSNWICQDIAGYGFSWFHDHLDPTEAPNILDASSCSSMVHNMVLHVKFTSTMVNNTSVNKSSSAMSKSSTGMVHNVEAAGSCPTSGSGPASGSARATAAQMLIGTAPSLSETSKKGMFQWKGQATGHLNKLRFVGLVQQHILQDSLIFGTAHGFRRRCSQQNSPLIPSQQRLLLATGPANLEIGQACMTVLGGFAWVSAAGESKWWPSVIEPSCSKSSSYLDPFLLPDWERSNTKAAFLKWCHSRGKQLLTLLRHVAWHAIRTHQNCNWGEWLNCFSNFWQILWSCTLVLS